MKNKRENLSENVIRNSSYDFISGLIAKFGGMIFTIFILARLLGPELFGIYALALSIIAIFLTFIDLGISSAATRYISEAIGRDDKKMARSYFKYFLKLKFTIAILIIVVILALARPLALDFYKQPLLFYPIVFSAFYLFVSSISSMPQTFFYALKDLRKIPKVQILEQSTKILLSLAAIYLVTYEFEVSGIFVAMAVSGIFVFLYSSLIIVKKDPKLIFGKKIEIEKPRVLKYTGFMALSSMSLVFFAAVDTLMLGKFVEPSYLGYYRAALGLVLSVGAILSARTILMPVFTQISKKRLQRGFEKVTRFNLIISIPSSVGLILISKQLIPLLYGSDYSHASSVLYILASLVVVATLIAGYKPLFSAREKPEVLAKATIYALSLNIILNYILIKSLLVYGPIYAILGAGFATLISRIYLLTIFYFKGKKELDISPFKNKSIFLKPIFASIIMIPFILSIKYLASYLTSASIVLVLLQVIIGASTYIATMYLIKGITEEDFKLVRYIPMPKFRN